MQDARGRSTRSSKRYGPVPDSLSLPGHEIQSCQSDPGQYLCIECNEAFDTKLELNSHRQSHVTKKQFTCVHCGRGFHHQVFLQMHERSHEDGVSKTTVTKTPCRVISTRSSKAVSSLVSDDVHVTPTATKPSDHLLNSTVEFRSERKVCQAFTPQECVTRRSQGTHVPAFQRGDAPEKKNRFELRISKFSDTTVHLIDTFGNTLEILSEVFNKYTIGEPEQESSADSPLSPNVKEHIDTLENIDAQKVSTNDTTGQKVSSEVNVLTASQDIYEDPSLVSQVEECEPVEQVNISEPIISVSISPKKQLDFSDVDLFTPPTSSNSDKDGTPCHEHLLNQPNYELPKITSDGINSKPPSIGQNDSLRNHNTSEIDDSVYKIDRGECVTKQQTDCESKASEGTLVEEVNSYDGDIGTEQMDSSPKLDTIPFVDILKPREQWKVQCALHDESSSTLNRSVAAQTPINDTKEKGLQNKCSTDTLVESMCEDDIDQSLLNDVGSVNEIGFLMNMNHDPSCENDRTNLNTNLSIGLPEFDALSKQVNDDQMSDQQSETERREENKESPRVDEVLLSALENNTYMTLVENDDQANVKSPLALDECLSELIEQHTENESHNSPRKVEPDRVLQEFQEVTQEQSESGKDVDYNILNRRPTNLEVGEKVSSKNISEGTELDLPRSDDLSQWDNGNQGTTWKPEIQSSSDDSSYLKDVDHTVTQDVSEKVSLCEMETGVSSPKPNNLWPLDSGGKEKITTSLVEQDALSDEHIMTVQSDTGLSEHDEKDLFKKGEIFPLDSQLKVPQQIHIPNKQNILQKETDNDAEVHKIVRDNCLNEPEESPVPSTILASNLEHEIDSSLQQNQEEEDTVNHINTDKRDQEFGSLDNHEPSAKDDINLFSKLDSQPEISDHKITTDAALSLATHDEQSIIPTDTESDQDGSLQDDAEIEINTDRFSSHVADSELDSPVSLLTSDKSGVNTNEKQDQETSVFMSVQESVSENDKENSFTDDSGSNHFIDEMLTEKCDLFVQELEQDCSFDQQNDVKNQDINSMKESSLPIIVNNDKISTHKNNLYASGSVQNDDCNSSERTNAFEASPVNHEIMKVFENESPGLLEYPDLKSVDSCDPEPNLNLENAGDGLLSPHNEVLSVSSLTSDKESQEVLFSGIPQISSKTTFSGEAKHFSIEQKAQIVKENENVTTPELDILQSLSGDQNDKDTNAVTSGSRNLLNEDLVDQQITFHEKDLNSELSFEKKIETEVTPDTEKVLNSPLHDISPSSDLDCFPGRHLHRSTSDGMKEECKEANLDENRSHEKLENTANSQVSSGDLILSDSGKSCRIKYVEDDFEDSSDVMHEPFPCQSRDEVTNDKSAVSMGDIETSSRKASDALSLCKSQSVFQDSTLDAPEGSQLTNGDTKESSSDRSLGVGGQCLKCSRKVRRSRKELVWSPLCFKCRLVAKRQEHLDKQEVCNSSDLVLETDMSNKEENVLSKFSNCQIKKEADHLQDEISEPVKSLNNASVLVDEQVEPGPIPKKTYKCQKCDKSFRIPALLAGHMKCHTLPQCLTCGCQMRLKYKTRRIPRRCQKCVQQIKEQKKGEGSLIGEKSGDEDSLKSDSEAPITSLSDNHSVKPEGDLKDSDITLSTVKSHRKPCTKGKFGQAKLQSVRVRRGTELFHSALLKKHKKVSSGIQALYCTCDASFRCGLRQSVKKCQHCHKLIRDRMITPPVSLEKAKMIGQIDDRLSDSSHDSDQGQRNKLQNNLTGNKKRPLKKVKKEQLPESETQITNRELMLGENPENHVRKSVNELNPCKIEDEICKKEDTESSSDEQTSDQSMSVPDGEKPRLCPQCGKTFKCNRSLNLHLLSHTAILCESCGCRLQKKRRAGRWSKKCRICRLHGKDPGIPADVEKAVPSDKIPKEKTRSSLQLKVKQPKSVKNRNIQSITKHKKDIKWMNKTLAVKGLKRKPRKKKEITCLQDHRKVDNELKKDLESPCSEPDNSNNVSSFIDDKTSIFTDVAALPKYDDHLHGLQEPGSSVVCNPQKNLLSGMHKQGRKCLYREKNIIKVEEDQILPYIHNTAASITPVSIKEEEENQCLECNQNFPSMDLLISHQQNHIDDQPFTCSQCPQSFSKEQYLSIHQNTHAEDRPFHCPECNKTFSRRNHLGVHRRVHTGARPFACPDCPCRFRQKGSLIIHRYTHRNVQLLMLKPYQCSVCSKSFKQRERLVVHERLHTGECPFSCKDCEKVFPSKARLYIHRKMHKTCKISSSVQSNIDCKESIETQSFQCQDCDKVCSTKASFVLHRKVHKLSSSSEQNLSQEQKVEEHPFHCKKCNKVFNTKASLTLHIKLHTAHRVATNDDQDLVLKGDMQGQPFNCKDCDKVCSTKASLVLHRKVHKSPSFSEQNLDSKAEVGSLPFICEYCDKVCSTKASFVLHSKVHKSSSSESILKTNVMQKSFICKDCNVVCSTKASFVLHSKVHKSSSSNEHNFKVDLEKRPFICKDCNKVCSTKASLVLHCRVHKSLSSNELNCSPEEHPFHCKDCGKLFSSKGKLSVHRKVHTEHEVCSSSDQNPSKKLDVEQQQKTDTEEKPFSCPKCRLRFTRLKMLVRHKLIHGEDGIFPCVHCGKRFLFQKSLLNHLKICQSRNNGKILLDQKKVATKRKSLKDIGDSSLGEENVPKKRKMNENKKVTSDVQKEKQKKLIKTKKLSIIKEKCKTKDIKDKKTKPKEKKSKGDGETDTDGDGKKSFQVKQEKPSEIVAKEKEAAKEKKGKDVQKVNKVMKKVPPKEKQQNKRSVSLKKWRLIAGTAVKKQKFQTVLSGGKKKEVKKSGPGKVKSGGKSGVKEKNEK